MGVNVIRKQSAASCYNKHKTMCSLRYGRFNSYNWKLSVRELYLYKNESFLILYSEMTLLIFTVHYITYRIYLNLRYLYIYIYTHTIYSKIFILTDIYIFQELSYIIPVFYEIIKKNVNSNIFYYSLVYIII